MGRLVITRAVAAIAMLAALPALAAGEDYAQRKETAVRTALEKQGKTGEFTTLIESSTRASAITAVTMGGTLGAPEVTIETEGRPAYEWFKLDRGKRIVIDFHNTVHLQSGLALAPIGAAPLLRVRTSLFALEPEFVSRVVVDLQKAAQPEFAQEDGKVTMRLRAAAPNTAEASLFDKAMHVASDLSQAQQQVASQEERLSEMVQRAALADAPEDASNEELAAFIAKAADTDAKTLERMGAVAENARKPLTAQRERLDELQTALYAKTIGTEKAKTTIQSIESEIRAASGQAEKEFGKIEKDLAASLETRTKTCETLLANAQASRDKAETEESKAEHEAGRIELAMSAPAEGLPLTEPVAEKPVETENATAPQPAVQETVETAIAKIERELASLQSTPEPSVAPAAEVIAATVEAPAPSSADALAKLDSLSEDMKHLAETIEAANTPHISDATSDMQMTTAAALDSTPAPAPIDAAPASLVTAAMTRTFMDESGAVPITTDVASVEPVSIDMIADGPATVDAAPAAPEAGDVAELPILLAQAEPSPEAPAADAPVEEAPAATEEAPEESATPADSAASEEQPAATGDAASEEPATTGEAEPPAVAEAPAEPAAPPKIIAAAKPAERESLPPGVDPLDQIVNIDFREMDLSSVVSLLAKKGQVNVIAGTEVTGTVTADIRNVPLHKAMDMVLRMNGLGVVEEEGIFRIVPYEEAVAARRTTKMVPLTNAQADDVRTTLEGILVGGRDAKLITVSANKVTNVLIISGPEERVAEFEEIARELDIKLPTLPTVTEAIKLNYLDPMSAKPIAETLKTDKIGKVEIDKEGRHVVVTDVPAAVEQMKQLLASVDKPVKQVAIEAMIVDAVLRDASQTGVDWTIDALRRHSSNGDLVSDLSQLTMDGNLGSVGTSALDAGVLQLGILSSEVRLNATIAAEVQSRNAQILASPSVVTVENQPATISIVQDFPYQELTQGLTGPPIASTEFKPIGVTLDVTPRITHTNDTIVDILAKQSSVSGLTETGVPIEDKREAHTTLRAQDGRTIFIGGLRNTSNNLNVSKIPVLGDIPVLNFMFRNTNAEKVNTELLIFLTCHVMDQELPDLTATQQKEFNKLDAEPKVPDGQRANFHDILRPQDMRDPMWKWRRSNR